MNTRTKAIPGMLMAAAIIALQIRDCNARINDPGIADYIAHSITQKAETAGANNFQTCIGTQVQNPQLVKTCRQTVTQQAGRTCQEITGWIAAEMPKTLELCEQAYRMGIQKAETILPKL